MSDSILQKQSKYKWKKRDDNEELKTRNKEHEEEEELASYQQARTGEENEQGTTMTLPTGPVCNDGQDILGATTTQSMQILQGCTDDDEVIQREIMQTSPTHQVSTEITVIKSRSPLFQCNLPRRNVAVPRRERPKSYPYSIGDDNVVGINEDVEKLVQQLIDHKSKNFLGIVGMGGSGKTTLARKIYNHKEIGRCFDCSAWICVSRVWNDETLIKELFAQTTGQKSYTLTLQETVEKLHKLLRDKSYLVVLDDVWEPDALRKIMMPTAKSPGSKFVITTRNQKVVQFSNLDIPMHEPRRLNPDVSLELFMKIAFDHQNNPNMSHNRNEAHVKLAKDMLRKCDGLPLAVVTLAGLLRRKKTIQDWTKVRNNVSSKIIEDSVGPSDYGRVEDMMMLSYLDLSHTLKSCFMYLGLLPEDIEISTEMLMRCWIAEGFFKYVQPGANDYLEDVAREYLDELIQRCLVQIVRVNYADNVQSIRVHDLLRDLAIKRAKRMYFFDTFPSTSTISRPIAMQSLRLGVVSRDAEIAVGYSSRLRSFVNFLGVKSEAGSDDPGIVYVNFKPIVTNYLLLRVLNLRGIFPHDFSLPDEIGTLIHLRYLGLRNTMILTLPASVENLRNLLTLECEITVVYAGVLRGDLRGRLPNLKQMKQLRHLCLPAHRLCYRKALNLQDLRDLRVLWGISAGYWMPELKELSPTVEKLGILEIKNSEQLEDVYQCPSIVQDCLKTLNLEWFDGQLELQKLRHCEQLQKLILSGEIAKSMSSEFPPNLLKLELASTMLSEQDPLTASLGKLAYLKLLFLHNNAYISCHLAFPIDSFQQLEEIELCQLPNLMGFHIIKGAIPRLKRMKVEDCKEFKTLPTGLKSMTALEKLEIRRPTTELYNRLRVVEPESQSRGEEPTGLKFMTALEKLEIRHPTTELYNRLRVVEPESQSRGEDLHIVQNIPSFQLNLY